MSMFQLLYQVIRVISAIFLKAWREMGQKLQTTKSRELCVFFKQKVCKTFEKMFILDIFLIGHVGWLALKSGGCCCWAGNLGCGSKRCSACGATWIPKKSLVFHGFFGFITTKWMFEHPSFFFGIFCSF